jgi:hypothetical protein
LSIA